MSKKRKTKREKVLSELRRKLNKTQNPPQTTLNGNTIKPAENVISATETIKKHIYPNKTNIHKNYSYVLKDINKTIVVTIFIVIANSLIFLLFEKNILSFKSLGF